MLRHADKAVVVNEPPSDTEAPESLFSDTEDGVIELAINGGDAGEIPASNTRGRIGSFELHDDNG